MISHSPLSFGILILNIVAFGLVSASAMKPSIISKCANSASAESQIPAPGSEVLEPVSSRARASFSVCLRTHTNMENQFSFRTILLSSSLTPTSFPLFSAADTCFKRKAEFKKVKHLQN